MPWSPEHCLCTDAEVPEGDAWLGPRERALYARLRTPPRRASWRLGRWTAKQLLGDRDCSPIEILTEPDGAPRVYGGAVPLELTLTLSHRAGRGLAAVMPGKVLLGCDIERIEARSAGFVRDFFTEREAASVAAAAEPELQANTIWSAKEAALKALRVGLFRDTREIDVTAAPEGELFVAVADGPRLAGSWRRDGDYVVTFVRAA